MKKIWIVWISYRGYTDSIKKQYGNVQTKGGKKMKKKIVSVLLTAVMAASLLAGCGNSSKPAESTPAEPAAPAATEEAKEETPADTTAETTADAGAADYSDVTLTFWSMWNSTEPQGKVNSGSCRCF